MAMLKQQDTDVGKISPSDTIFGPTVSETSGLSTGGASGAPGSGPETIAPAGGGGGNEGPQVITPLPPKLPLEIPPKYIRTTTVPTPITPYNVPTTPPSSLANILSLSKVSSERTYVKGTMRSVGDDYIVSTNTSDTITIAVKFTGISGVSFEPSSFNLSPVEQKIITVHFDPGEFEKLAEGVNSINTVVDVSAIAITEQPVTIAIPATPLPNVPLPDVPVPVVQPPVVPQGGTSGGGITERTIKVNSETGEVDIFNRQVQQE